MARHTKQGFSRRARRPLEVGGYSPASQIGVPLFMSTKVRIIDKNRWEVKVSKFSLRREPSMG
jgi:hypothetical protein